MMEIVTMDIAATRTVDRRGLFLFPCIALSLLFLCLGCGKKSGREAARAVFDPDEAFLFLVCSPLPDRRWDVVPEHGSFFPLKEAMVAEELKANGGYLTRTHVMSDGTRQEFLRYAVIRMEGEGERGLYRLLYSVGQVRGSKDFRYDGEEWLPVASGNRWYAAVIRNWEW